ncbi:MAG: fimbrillin family protein [Bacteroidales bacterium]|nr:fimbrillin family protein [Bacteroidales bacterium]
MRRFLIVIMALMISSCVKNEMGDRDLCSNSRIEFVASDYEVAVTRAPDDAEVAAPLFIGMMGTDSIFLTMVEEPIPPRVVTKGEGSVEEFSIVGFKDDEQSPYVNLKVSTENNWVSYEPALYWPYRFDELHFFASSPNENNTLFTPVSYTVDSENDNFGVVLDYTVPAGEENQSADVQVDLIYAIAPGQTKENSPCELTFVHLLSSVEFQIGDVGDNTADISEAIVVLNNVKSTGRCTLEASTIAENVTCLTAENITWSLNEKLEEYSKIVEPGLAFKVIPQMIDGSEISFELTLKIGDVTHTFPEIPMKDISSEWKANKKYTYTLRKQGEVKVDVGATADNHTISGVSIQNRGFNTSYIRAAIVGYWSVVDESGVEVAAASWDINEASVGTLVKGTGWENHWVEIDGFYYHLSPVAPSGYTATLFDRYELKKITAPVSGSELKISVVTQAVEVGKVAEAWPEFTPPSN